MSLRVLIADDDPMLRDGLRSLLESKEDIEVIGEAGDGTEAIELSRALRPDVVIMDISMPRLNGFEATRRLKASDPTVKVIGLSVHSNNLYVVEMLEAGAAGYVLKAAVYDELYPALQAVGQGRSYLSPSIAGVSGEAVYRVLRGIAAAPADPVQGGG
jgi:two-component system response regulator NreC